MTTELTAHVLDKSLMDQTVRPQDDFFRHVNGSWLATHEIPADRASDSAFRHLQDLSEERGHAIVDDAVAGTIDDPDAQRIATIYGQFMDEDSIEATGASPLAPELEEIAAATTHSELAEVAGRLARGVNPLFFVTFVNNDVNDSTRYVVHLYQAGLGLPDESYYRGDQYADVRTAYVSHVARALALAGVATGDEAAAAATRLMDFETKLASHHWDQVASRDSQKTNNPRSWDALVAENPGFDWEAWARGIGYDSTIVDTLNVYQPDFLQAASALWASTDLDTLKLWIQRDLIDSRSPLLSSAFVEEQFDFYARTLAGTQELRPRWRRGLGLVESTLGEALGRLYVARHFPPEHKAQMEHLVQRLLDAYKDSITQLDWMGEETKQKALLKISTFNPKIAYPPKWRDYSSLTISPDATLVDNVRAAENFLTDIEWNKLGKPVDRDEWLMTPQTVNAYYNPPMNEIVFPAAILQPPFFDPEADDAVNFGGIGAVIGHEIGHGFDDQGSQYDEDGNLHNWWTDEDRSEFEKRTKALIAQYDSFTPVQLANLPGEYHVNGALTIGENIGDLGGLTIAWRAWAAALADQGISSPEDAPVIDGLTGPQRFFYSWASIWREKRRDPIAIQYLAIDPHSPAEFRCNGVLRNMDAFTDTFDVHPDDGLWLDAEDRVHIW